MNKRVFIFKVSRQLFVLQLVIVMMGAIGLVSSGLSWCYQLLLFVLLFFVSLSIFLKFVFLKHKQSILGLIFDKGRWFSQFYQGVISSRVLGSSFVSSKMVVLNLKIQGYSGVRTCLILPDSLSQNDFKALIVALRFYTETI